MGRSSGAFQLTKILGALSEASSNLAGLLKKQGIDINEDALFLDLQNLVCRHGRGEVVCSEEETTASVTTEGTPAWNMAADLICSAALTWQQASQNKDKKGQQDSLLLAMEAFTAPGIDQLVRALDQVNATATQPSEVEVKEETSVPNATIAEETLQVVNEGQDDENLPTSAGRHRLRKTIQVAGDEDIARLALANRVSRDGSSSNRRLAEGLLS